MIRYCGVARAMAFWLHGSPVQRGFISRKKSDLVILRYTIFNAAEGSGLHL